MKKKSDPLAERLARLQDCPLFSGLPEDELRLLAKLAGRRDYAAGESLFRQGDRAEGFYVVVKGQLKVCRLGREGREQVLHILGPGEVCGEVPVFQGGHYPATAMAVGSLSTLYIPGDKFLELGLRQPEILLEMLAILSVRLRGFVRLIDDLSLQEISARLAKHLLDLEARQGHAGELRLECAKTVLAARLGTVAETLSRTLRKLQDRQIVTVTGKTVRLLDREALQDVAAGMKL